MPEQKEHLVPHRIYVSVLAALMALLAITVVMAFVNVDAVTKSWHLGTGWNTAISLAIAISKGLLIVMFFMHARYGSRLTMVAAAAGFVWLGIMLTLTMTDYLSRNHPPGASYRGEPKYLIPLDRPEPRTPQIDSFPGQPGSYH